jgi:hypothetical protein
MNSDTSTEMIVPANISWPYLSRKNLTRDIPTTTNNYISIGNWVLQNGSAYFEISTQVNASGFTISKSYRLSVINNATNNVWQKVLPEVDSGQSGSNNFDLLINSNGSTVSFRIKRASGSTAGEIKIYISKYGSLDDVFTSAQDTGGPLSISVNYPRAYGLDAVYLNEENTFTANQTINAKLTVKGDTSTSPSVRFGAGTSALSTVSSVDGSFILQGASGGNRSQFEIIAPTGNNRIILESDSVSGSFLYPQGGDLKFNAASVSQVYYGNNTSKGVMFAAGLTGSTDIGISRVSSGILKINNGGAGYGSISIQNLRVNSTDSSKTQSIYASGSYAYLENSSGNPVGFICSYGTGMAAAITASSDKTVISYDILGPFGIAAQSNSLVKNSPGTGTLNYRLFFNTNGDIGVNTISPTQRLDVNGNIKCNNFYGNGANLTSVNSSNLVGTISGSLLPSPTISVLGGVKRNLGVLGQYVSGVSSDGTLLYGTLDSNFSKTVAVLSPKDFDSPVTGFTANLSTRNGRPILNFHDITGQSALWSLLMPYDAYLNSGLEFNAWWSSQVTAGTVGWRIYLEKINDAAIISSDNFFGPYDIGTSAVPASGRIKKTTIALTSGNLSGISPGDVFRVRISRNIDVDTAAGIAELHKVELRTLNTYPSQFIP